MVNANNNFDRQLLINLYLRNAAKIKSKLQLHLFLSTDTSDALIDLLSCTHRSVLSQAHHQRAIV